MSDTPRTDAAQIELLEVKTPQPYRVVERWVVRADFARALERENAALRTQLAERQAAIDEVVACKEPINDGGKRAHLAWSALRALATKEPQPATKETTK